MTSTSCPNGTATAATVGVGLAVKVAEEKDEGEGVANKDVLHPSGERTSGQDGIQSQDDAGRELNL